MQKVRNLSTSYSFVLHSSKMNFLFVERKLTLLDHTAKKLEPFSKWCFLSERRRHSWFFWLPVFKRLWMWRLNRSPAMPAYPFTLNFSRIANLVRLGTRPSSRGNVSLAISCVFLSLDGRHCLPVSFDGGRMAVSSFSAKCLSAKFGSNLSLDLIALSFISNLQWFGGRGRHFFDRSHYWYDWLHHAIDEKCYIGFVSRRLYCTIVWQSLCLSSGRRIQ